MSFIDDSIVVKGPSPKCPMCHAVLAIGPAAKESNISSMSCPTHGYLGEYDHDFKLGITGAQGPISKAG